MFEAACETQGTCNVDQYSQKAYMARWLAGTSVLAPYTAPRVGELLKASAVGAAASCSGGGDSTTCGSRWYINGWDQISGLGQQLSALEVIYALLANRTSPPMTQGGVRIRSEPTYRGSLVPAEPSGSRQTARPLYDRSEGGAPTGRGFDGLRGVVMVGMVGVVVFLGLGGF